MPAAFLKCLLPSCVPAALLDFNDIWDCYWWDICNIRYIYGLYMNKIFPIISPIYHENQNHISVIWIWEKSEQIRPPPLFWTFSKICDIFCLDCSPNPQVWQTLSSWIWMAKKNQCFSTFPNSFLGLNFFNRPWPLPSTKFHQRLLFQGHKNLGNVQKLVYLFHWGILSVAV